MIPLKTPGPFDHDYRVPGPHIPIDLDLPDHHTALIGARGSGKTTLLGWLAGQDKNIITLDDTTPEEAQEWADEFPSKRIFAVVNTAVPGFTSREILPFGQSEISLYLKDQRELRAKLEQHPALMELAATPAILAEISRMDRQGVRFPQQRAQLYAWILDRLGPIDHPAIRTYRECLSLKTIPDDAERFSLLGAIEWARNGKSAVDSLVDTACSSQRPAVETVANLYALETDLMPLGYRIESPTYQQMVQSMTMLFDDTPESAVIPLRTKVAAAEALGRAGDPRLRLPSDPGYWVSIDSGLEIGRFPVTVYEFSAFVQATGKQPEDWANQMLHPSRPVAGVDWYIAGDFCRWAGGRLPEEQEWMRTLAGRYAWGDEDPGPQHGNFNFHGLNCPTPVGLFPRGNTPQSGIADLQGNVWEWTATAAEKADDDVSKILLGNSCRGYPASIRGWNFAGYRHEVIGFRCVRDVRSL